MNYRHGFHAGNFADVFKHAMLARILVYLTRKDAPLRYIDTHAGAGRYDLAGEAARRSPEWRDGVGRIVKARPPAEVAALLRPYLDAVGPCDDDGRPASYPGSPALAQTPAAAAGPPRALRSASGGARSPRRGARARPPAVDRRHRRLCRAQRLCAAEGAARLVLIDPPYEAPDEAKRVEVALARALAKWPRGTYALWRPIKDEREDARFLNAVAAIGAPNMLRLEIDVGPIAPGPHSPAPLRRTGLIVVNPPFGLIEEARALIPWLTKLLTRAGKGAHVVEWLTPPA